MAHVPVSVGLVKSFIVNHLNRIYAAKIHLLKKLPLLLNHVKFSVLQDVILETVKDVENQLARIEMVYNLIDCKASLKRIKGLTSLIDEAFHSIERAINDDEISDLSIIFYLQNIKSVEMSSFQMLQIASAKLGNDEVSELLTENFKAAKMDRLLFVHVSTKYVINPV
ncbi:hypothetical protein OC25_02250 [Pedobacter kyungheensis]|uniref:Uncharacterized protein n=1 Tax=Pedobacter kyungheensis TaxID=1069985 RepID=A0A0C1G9G7_9SPHI|nr:hypothetical protein OC25_02250 [Pedobacter kyungheensis]